MSLPELPDGTYTISVKAPGFKEAASTAIRVARVQYGSSELPAPARKRLGAGDG